MNMDNALVVFQGKDIRRIWHAGAWYFSITDIISVLTESSIPRRYWSDLKSKLKEEGFELYDKIVQLKLASADGKKYETDCANTEFLFRIIQSIPSKKAEPFKLWLAKVGYERVQEIENPELAQDRVKEYYEIKGYSKDWIDKRLRGIAIRQELTEEWKHREIKTENDFAILTNEISKATFGMTVGEYKEFKKLQQKNQNLRDHMTDWELILTMVGEKATTDITKEADAAGLEECKKSAQEGGDVARTTREHIERKLGKRVVSSENFLEKAKRKRLELK